MSIGIIKIGLYTLTLSDDLELSGGSPEILAVARDLLSEIVASTSPSDGDPRFYALEKLGEAIRADSVTNQFSVDESKGELDLVY